MGSSARIGAGRGERWVARLTRAGDGAFALRLVTAAGDEQLADVGPCRVLFAGLLQNRDELRVGDPAQTDAELVADGYLRGGDEFLTTLRGVFAVVLTDSRQQLAICVRDQLGRHPLFWAEDDGDVVVSASAKTLIAQPGISSAVNVPALVDQLRHRWLFVEETFYEAVRRVPPGHALRVTPHARDLVGFWDPAPPGEPIDWLSADDVDRFGDVLETAVRRSVGNRPAGIFLSGGLDSVSVAALASATARQLDLPTPWALSLVFPPPEVSEEEIQRRVAADLGLPQVLLPWNEAVGPNGLISSALELSARAPAPLGNFWSPAYDRLAEEGKRRGCRTILAGEGGDEWLGVSPYYAADLLRTGNILGLYRLYSVQLRSYPVSPWAFTRNLVWHFSVRPVLSREAKRLVRRRAPHVELARRVRRAEAGVPPWLAPDLELRAGIADRERQAYRDVLESEAWLSAPLPRSYPHHYLHEVRSSLTHPLVAMEHEERFEQAQRMAIPLLQPFWDADVVEFLYRTPPELLNRGGRSKSVVRAALATRFPEIGFERQRKVSAARFARSLFLDEGRRAWRRNGGAQALAAAGIVDGDRANSAVEEILHDPRGRNAARIWDLLRCEVWFRAQT